MSEKSSELEWSPSERFKEIMDKEEISTEDMRDALKECYIDASGGDEEIALNILKKQFKEVGASWEDPSLDELKDVMERLADISEDIRSEDVIKVNYQKMMRLMRKRMDDL